MDLKGCKLADRTVTETAVVSFISALVSASIYCAFMKLKWHISTHNAFADKLWGSNCFHKEEQKGLHNPPM